MTRCRICHDPLPDDAPTCGGFTCEMEHAGWSLREEPALLGDGRREWVHDNGSVVTDDHARDVWTELRRTPPPF